MEEMQAKLLKERTELEEQNVSYSLLNNNFLCLKTSAKASFSAKS